MTEPEKTEAALRWTVHGRVQGVWFRDFTSREARRLGVRGWVRNQADGTVRAEAAGTPAALAALRARLEVGPPAARVDQIVEEPLAEAGDWPSFSVRR